ncbi:hypothetical protein EL23_01660 [Paenibacillus polymyxa]|nr:hypothetical protein EL23_01660 [Paenibacillus polymyxa]
MVLPIRWDNPVAHEKEIDKIWNGRSPGRWTTIQKIQNDQAAPSERYSLVFLGSAYTMAILLQKYD